MSAAVFGDGPAQGGKQLGSVASGAGQLSRNFCKWEQTSGMVSGGKGAVVSITDRCEGTSFGLVEIYPRCHNM